jgi:predicted aspartyl protease
LEFKRGHPFVSAQANGATSVWLMIDTGFSITMVDPRLAELLKLKPIGKTTIAGIAGEERANVFEGPTFNFAGQSYTPRRVGVLSSEQGRRGRRLEGILGSGFFRRFVVEMDPKAKTIKLHNPKQYHYTGPGEIIPVSLRNTTPVVDASINIPGRPPIHGRYEIDTGCDGGLCLGHDFVESEKLLDSAGRILGGGRAGVGGDAQTKVGSVPQFQIGQLTVEKPEVNFFLKGSPVEGRLAGHIGIDLLRQFKSIFDYSRQQLILEPYTK